MRLVLLIALAAVSLTASIFFFGALSLSVLFVLTTGHPPHTVLGMWILPLSLLGAGTGMYLYALLVKAMRKTDAGGLKAEAKLLPLKLCVLFVSFAVTALLFLLFSWLVEVLSIRTALPHRLIDVIYAVCGGAAIAGGMFTYRALAKALF